MRPLASLATVVVMAATASAQAQANVRLSTQVSARRVEVGQTFRLQLTAFSEADGDTPSSPRLTLPKSITSQGPSVSTQRQVSIQHENIFRTMHRI